jgi:hypothetical protein
VSAPPPAPSADQQQPLDALHVKADREPFGMRVDLFRVDKNSDPALNAMVAQGGNTYVAVSPSTYALTGVDLGNGLFYDTNGNLGLDLVRFYGLEPPFAVEETQVRFVTRKVTFTVEGNTFRRIGGGDDNPDQIVTFRSDSWNVDGAANAYHGTVLTDSDGLVFSGAGQLLGKGKVVLRQVKDTRIELPSLLGDVVFSATDDDELRLSNKFHLKTVGNVLTIQPTGYMVANEAAYRFVRTATGCWFSDPQGNSHEVSRDGSTISVLKNGKLEETFVVKSAGQ